MHDKLILGRYVDTGSWVHRLDARSKLSAMVLFLLAVTMIDSFAKAALAALFSASIMAASRVPIRYFVRAVKPLLALVVFLVLFHLLFDASGTRYVSLGFITLHSGGLERGLLAAARMLLFLALTSVLTFTTLPASLAHAIEDMLSPLEKLGLSPRKISFMIGIALRFIPTVFEEADKIRKAQASRGMDLSDLPLPEKARKLISLLVPVTVGSFRRALELSESMESRGYRFRGARSRYQALVWRQGDSWFLLAFAAFVVAMALPVF